MFVFIYTEEGGATGEEAQGWGGRALEIVVGNSPAGKPTPVYPLKGGGGGDILSARLLPHLSPTTHTCAISR